MNRTDETVVGAASSFDTNSVDECLNWCVGNLTCVGVDVDYNETPIRCWPHFNSSSYVDSNIWGQPGTNSYQLLTRCAETTEAPSTTAAPS